MGPVSIHRTKLLRLFYALSRIRDQFQLHSCFNFRIFTMIYICCAHKAKWPGSVIILIKFTLLLQTNDLILSDLNTTSRPSCCAILITDEIHANVICENQQCAFHNIINANCRITIIHWYANYWKMFWNGCKTLCQIPHTKWYWAETIHPKINTM